MQNLLNGILYLHVNEIIHRDINLDNIFVKNINRPNEIMLKIINLTKAERYNKQSDNNDTLFEKIGSPYYIALKFFAKIIIVNAIYGPQELSFIIYYMVIFLLWEKTMMKFMQN